MATLQTIPEEVWNVYKELKDGGMVPQRRNTAFCVDKSNRVKTACLIESLNIEKQSFKNKNMQFKIDSLVGKVRGMTASGKAQIFSVYDTESKFEKDIEYLCIALKKYEITQSDGTCAEVCDSFLATYSYKRTIDTQALTDGGLATCLAGAFAALAVYGFASGKVNANVGGGVASVAAVVASSVAKEAFSKVPPKSIEEQFKPVLEASFIYEIVRRGHAAVDEETKTLVLVEEDSEKGRLLQVT